MSFYSITSVESRAKTEHWFDDDELNMFSFYVKSSPRWIANVQTCYNKMGIRKQWRQSYFYAQLHIASYTYIDNKFVNKYNGYTSNAYWKHGWHESIMLNNYLLVMSDELSSTCLTRFEVPWHRSTNFSSTMNASQSVNCSTNKTWINWNTSLEIYHPNFTV